MASWEDRLSSWTGPASANEDDKRERTEREIKTALARHPVLSDMDLRVYAKGSYANNTNVRLDSDVDIAVENRSIFHADGLGDDSIPRQEVGFTPYSGPLPTFESFKTTVHDALTDAFGSSAVKRKNRCITVRERSTTLPADVVPCWEYHDYYRDWQGRATYQQGTVLWADRDRMRVENYPQQHYDNGVAKNNRTRRRYKQLVRAIKRLENDMVDKGVIDECPSYLIECLVYACPDQVFGHPQLLENAREVIRAICRSTEGPEPTVDSRRLTEANEIKFLFTPQQKWTRDQANDFALAAWAHMKLQ